jgi:hypothetical protein
MRTLIAAILFILALSSVALGQTEYLAAYADLKASLKLTEDKIKSERPETSRSALRCDRSVITSSIAAVEKSFLEKGFNKNDAEEVSLLAWKPQRRLLPPPKLAPHFQP